MLTKKRGNIAVQCSRKSTGLRESGYLISGPNPLLLISRVTLHNHSLCFGLHVCNIRWLDNMSLRSPFLFLHFMNLWKPFLQWYCIKRFYSHALYFPISIWQWAQNYWRREAQNWLLSFLPSIFSPACCYYEELNATWWPRFDYWTVSSAGKRTMSNLLCGSPQNCGSGSYMHCSACLLNWPFECLTVLNLCGDLLKVNCSAWQVIHDSYLLLLILIMYHISKNILHRPRNL